ncbi:SGNH/GDSL hydrolase family protein [Dysgonomonas sp. 511]|uniref:SGNH/GDSL hydrolase family protein n=1 Tax=Dysgonomonas sp. 511 TaxID=2302930 RepID=UPI0013CF7F5B|nr:SGNH/GDSL hydrolase family protein [Dysgonomonas sp. 511]NDV78185.1 hydrolase [Dysgonomonas sp. 511]
MKTSCIKTFLLISIFSFLSASLSIAQEKVYTDARELTMVGKAKPIPQFYHRVDTAKYNTMPLGVKRLFTNSAGLAIVFKTNSNSISARWSTLNQRKSNNMTGIVYKGLDLYIKRNNEWVFAGVGRPADNPTTAAIVSNMEDGEKECLLYLSLYDEVKSLEIGVDEGSYIAAMESPFRKKVVIYGSSILQGASASRPGMAYPARMARKLGVDFINLGLSGNGKMEPEVVDMIAGIEADAYILDCAPNPSPEQITERTTYLVETIRKNHPQVPIVMIQSIVRETGNFDVKAREVVAGQNRNFKAEYDKLVAAGVKDLYYIEGNLIGSDHEGTTDGIHPNDLGFDRMLQVIQPFVADILKKYGI